MRVFALRAEARVAVALVRLACLSVSPACLAGAEWERDFKSPPLALKSLPLWHLNGTLTSAGIAAQLQDAHDASGFAGVAVLPVKETQPEYLSEAYFERYGDILETSSAGNRSDPNGVRAALGRDIKE